MLGELVNIPTDRLIDLLFVMLSAELAITSNDVADIEQIQRELYRRGATLDFGTVN
jgi:hypothetical protein